MIQNLFSELYLNFQQNRSFSVYNLINYFSFNFALHGNCPIFGKKNVLKELLTSIY